MNDFNRNGKFDKEDLLFLEEEEANTDPNADATLPVIVVGVIMLGIFVAIKILL